MACRCMRTFGGGVNARCGPLVAATGNSTAVFTSAATRGASGSAATRGSAAAFTGGATNGRTTFGGPTATTLGSGMTLDTAIPLMKYQQLTHCCNRIHLLLTSSSHPV